MAEPTPPLPDYAQNTPPDGGRPQERPFVFLLTPPLSATSLQRRAADVKRRHLRWTEGSPPGLYWNGHVNRYKPVVMMGYDQPIDGPQAASSVDAAGDSASGAVGHVESDAEDSARSLASSPTSSVSSECSASPSTPPDSPTERAVEVKRRAAVSQSRYIKGDLVEVTLDAELNDFTIDRQGYMLELTIPQTDVYSEGGIDELAFKLHIDTASNITWILGHDYCCAEVSSRDTEGHPTQISLKDWEGVPPGHPTLKPHPDRWEVIRPPRDLIQPFPPHVLYYDKGLVLISQLREARVFTVNRFYNWSQTHRWNEPRRFPGYRFAVAYAVDKDTAYDRTNGSLGLGPMRKQGNIPAEDAEQAFASFLASHFSPSNAFDFIDGGCSLYFAMRPPWADRRVDPSWLSVGRWPGRPIQLSEKIPVFTANNVDPEYWSVEMLWITLYYVGGTSRTRFGTVDLRPITPGSVEQGAIFVLDTGSGTSEFPDEAINQLRDDFFLADKNKNPLRNYPFTIPADNRETEIEIDFAFRGEGSTPVIVPGPAMPFLYQKSDPESRALIYPGNGPTYILGANFFQAMFVAMYRPDGNNELPFVRLARQNQSEPAYSIVPPEDN